MTTGITAWLRTKDRPAHLYALLGRPLLDPDREGLLTALRAANRELLDYQSHPDRATAARALELLTELGRARGTLDDPARLAAHDAALVESLRREGGCGRRARPGRGRGGRRGVARPVPRARRRRCRARRPAARPTDADANTGVLGGPEAGSDLAARPAPAGRAAG
jgi:hypothetical protein